MSGVIATLLIGMATVVVAGAEVSTPPGVVPRLAIITTKHVLQPEDLLRLRSEGVEILEPTGGGRYLALVRGEGPDDAEIISSTDLTPSLKVLPTAAQELANVESTARLRVFFAPRFDPGEARSLVAGAGGEVITADGFETFRSLEVALPRAAVMRLLEHPEIVALAGPERERHPMNLTAAKATRVRELHDPIYDLSGSGMLVTVQEVLGIARLDHQELRGRVTSSSSLPVDTHATHVTGTIAATGIRSSAKGMAPEVLVHFPDSSGSRRWWDAKGDYLNELGSVADNNSWGYRSGWESAPNFLDPWWEWSGFTNPGYTFEGAVLDAVARESDALIVFSANNQGNDDGPSEAPWPHQHAGQTTIFCSPAPGSGPGCPGAPCEACEPERHPPDGPFGTVSVVSQAKNAMVVGALDSPEDGIADFSARGPTVDGRLKPDLVAPGVSIFSTFDRFFVGGPYGNMSGTSVSAPVVTGIAALVAEQWTRTMPVAPTAAAIKALLLHTAKDLGNEGPDYTYGFGLVQAAPAVDLIVQDGGSASRIRTEQIAHGEILTFEIEPTPADEVRATLVWQDAEISSVDIESGRTLLVNDLDIEVVTPEGETRHPFVLDPEQPEAPAETGVNVRDNAEQLVIAEPDPGPYRIRVRGRSIPVEPQSFTLVSSVPMSATSRCRDSNEPNDAISTARLLQSARELEGALCDSSDSDFFRFAVSRQGTVKVRVTAFTDSLEVRIHRNGIVVKEWSAEPNEDLTYEAFEDGGERARYILEILAPGSSAAPGYLVSSEYPSSSRRRAVQR